MSVLCSVHRKWTYAPYISFIRCLPGNCLTTLDGDLSCCSSFQLVVCRLYFGIVEFSYFASLSVHLVVWDTIQYAFWLLYLRAPSEYQIHTESNSDLRDESILSIFSPCTYIPTDTRSVCYELAFIRYGRVACGDWWVRIVYVYVRLIFNIFRSI